MPEQIKRKMGTLKYEVGFHKKVKREQNKENDVRVVGWITH